MVLFSCCVVEYLKDLKCVGFIFSIFCISEYFFSKPNYMNTNSNRRSRTTDEGFYKSTGKVREIKAEQSQAVIGNKRILSYYEGRVPKAKKTKHVMHEYSVTKTKLAQLGAQNNQQRELVLCHLTNKSAKSEKLKDDSICGDELAEPAIGNEISYNSEDDQAAATDMIQGPDEHLANKDALLGTENRNECADPSCADLGENMDSTFISPEQLAATSATTPTSATSFGGFGVGSPDGFLLSDFDDGFLLSDFDVLF
ncbi:NAC domain-containing protein 68-like [Prunus dulcis]|uniref:NAC domain-containing protein 68-like n=1 Tax=Prunus dulcis TaxID=3755 RepID=UPI001482719C|nr:NAC domain-containing protein 68-like [Prunus dulcis]